MTTRRPLREREGERICEECDVHVEKMNVWHFREENGKKAERVEWYEAISCHITQSGKHHRPFQLSLRETDFWVMNIRGVKGRQEQLLLFFHHDTVTWEAWQSFRMAALHPDSPAGHCVPRWEIFGFVGKWIMRSVWEVHEEL